MGAGLGACFAAVRRLGGSLLAGLAFIRITEAIINLEIQPKFLKQSCHKKPEIIA
jgi:hypothetical protein